MIRKRGMSMRRLSLAALVAIVMISPVAAEEPPPLSPAWQSSLDGYLGDVRTLGNSWKLPSVTQQVAGMRGYLTPLVRQVDAARRPLSERVTLQTGEGPMVRQRSTADVDGRRALLEEAAFGLTPPMGMVLRSGTTPGDQVLSRYGQRMDQTRLPLDGTYRDVLARTHRQLAPSVVETMQGYPDPGQNTLNQLQPWHQFFREADQFYLPSLKNNWGLQVPEAELARLQAARARHQLVDQRMQAAGVWDPKTWTYDPVRLQQVGDLPPSAFAPDGTLVVPDPAADPAAAAPAAGTAPSNSGLLFRIFGQ